MRPINAETLKASMMLDGLTMMLLGKKYELSDALKTVDNAPTIALEPEKGLPPAQPEYEELTPEEAAAEIASGSTMSAWHLVDDMMRLTQMGYVICRKK